MSSVDRLAGIAYVVVVDTSSLTLGNTKSCGCLQKEIARDFCKSRTKYSINEAAARQLYGNSKTDAFNRKLVWDLSYDSWHSIVIFPCFYCNAAPIARGNERRGGHILANGLDRVDNTKGYQEDNIVSCCEPCNRSKMDGTLEDYLVRCFNVAEKFAYLRPYMQG
jgi:hypothetical protein